MWNEPFRRHFEQRNEIERNISLKIELVLLLLTHGRRGKELLSTKYRSSPKPLCFFFWTISVRTIPILLERNFLLYQVFTDLRLLLVLHQWRHISVGFSSFSQVSFPGLITGSFYSIRRISVSDTKNRFHLALSGENVTLLLMQNDLGAEAPNTRPWKTPVMVKRIGVQLLVLVSQTFQRLCTKVFVVVQYFARKQLIESNFVRFMLWIYGWRRRCCSIGSGD